jgi:3',5'-cyclic AMP phosphodiesterase CpdA
MRVAAATLKQIESGALDSDPGRAILESTDVPVHPSAIANALAAALEWAHLDRQVGAGAALESADPGAAELPYIPNNQVLALLQSAYDEYQESKAAKPTSELEMPFDTADIGWLTVAFEKLKELFRGKHKFIKHTSLDSFRQPLPANATVALFADWGTGEATAQRVMEQIKARQPTHAIHLGDVYYSGTPNEVRNRFLKVIDQFGPQPSECKFFALNSNHEMFSGGYGYFDTTLPRFGQPASYFCLFNRDWQMIGIDSGYEDHGLQDPQKEWLTAQLRRQGPANIVLSHHQLFSPYESVSDRRMPRRTADVLANIFAWFWGHEHKCIIFGDHLGIKARCIGHGAIPSSVPYGAPRFVDVPITKVDERRSPDGVNVHGFALLKFAGSRLDVSYIDEFGVEFFTERLDAPAAPAVSVQPVPTEAPPDRGAIMARQSRMMRGPSATSLESLDDGPEGMDLSQPAIDDRIGSTRAALHEIVKNHLGDSAVLHEIADRIANEGHSALRDLGRGEPINPASAERVFSALEVIVRADGSRPSFMVRNGAVDLTTSPAGAWKDQIVASPDLEAGISCVGRIDLPDGAQGFVGTGFLIHPDLIVTNRHVLQAIGRSDVSGVWTLEPQASIDFGHEFRARNSVSPRPLKRVVFCGSRAIVPSAIDHRKLDLVVIELQSVPEDQRPLRVLGFDISPDWASPEAFVYTVGYPGNPGLGEPLSLLELLFQSTFGCKRLAPGTIQTAQSAVAPWTLAHDSTTLGGNSGSVVLRPGREGVAAGLHYGGRRLDPRENWGHILGLVLDEPDSPSGKSLRDVLNAFGVQLIDRGVKT